MLYRCRCFTAGHLLTPRPKRSSAYPSGLEKSNPLLNLTQKKPDGPRDHPASNMLASFLEVTEGIPELLHDLHHTFVVWSLCSVTNKSILHSHKIEKTLRSVLLTSESLF